MQGSYTRHILNQVEARRQLVYRVTAALSVRNWQEAQEFLEKFFLLDWGEAGQIVEHYKLTGEFNPENLALRHN